MSYVYVGGQKKKNNKTDSKQLNSSNWVTNE
jgi:hypothetical protein